MMNGRLTAYTMDISTVRRTDASRLTGMTAPFVTASNERQRLPGRCRAGVVGGPLRALADQRTAVEILTQPGGRLPCRHARTRQTRREDHGSVLVS